MVFCGYDINVVIFYPVRSEIGPFFHSVFKIYFFAFTFYVFASWYTLKNITLLQGCWPNNPVTALHINMI